MPDYPIVLNLQDRLCVVVGGGAVGRRKARGLRAAGARVRLIAPQVVDAATLEGMEILQRPYRSGDLQGAFLAFAATDSRRVNAAVLREAKRRKILVNVADLPPAGDFTLPAVLRRGELAVAVSTGGVSPVLAALIRDRLARELGPEWETVLAIAAVLRQKRLTPDEETEYNQGVLRQLVDDGLPLLLAQGRVPEVDRLLNALLGEGFSLADLAPSPPKGTR